MMELLPYVFLALVSLVFLMSAHCFRTFQKRALSSSVRRQLVTQETKMQHLQQLKKDPYFNAQRINSALQINIDLPPYREIATTKKHVRCYCISDLHADYPANLQWVREKCVRQEADADAFTILVIPGDIGALTDRIATVFAAVTPSYDLVCFIPGNHEMWLRGAESRGKHSIEKMQAVNKVAKEAGVHVGPVRVCFQDAADANQRSLLLQPLHAWYHASWDQEPALQHPIFTALQSAIPFHRRWSDFSVCDWPEELCTHEAFVENSPKLAEAFARLNEVHIKPIPEHVETIESPDTVFGSPYLSSESTRDTLITYSHYLPRQELCPEKRFLLEPKLSEVVGSMPLESQIRRLRPHLHLFGHTHIPIDLTLDGLRYLQWPLGYQRERGAQCAATSAHGPLCVYDSALGDGEASMPKDSPSLSLSWTDYYRNNARQPQIIEPLAPWLLQRLESQAGISSGRLEQQEEKQK